MVFGCETERRIAAFILGRVFLFQFTEMNLRNTHKIICMVQKFMGVSSFYMNCALY